MSRPFVSVVTPTYNRRRFLPSLIQCYLSQTYPKDRMEWIILDDGEDCVRDVFEEAIKKHSIPNVRYIYKDEKHLIGAKRNILNKEAKGEILVAMDDDDFYFPERVAHAVTRLQAAPKVELAGSSEIFMYYTDIQKIYRLGPYGERHATNGTMAWRKSYTLTHTYDETVTFAEEKSFLDQYRHPMVQLDPKKVMLVISHSENTFDKKKLRDTPNPYMKLTDIKLSQFIRDANLRAFFSKA
uniref:Glycosyltransferase 2-like domain-containing protein n=1 Tax=viral metagenome TaxID=1070528 RepID=A0A6C0DNZ2_9ZZZZ